MIEFRCKHAMIVVLVVLDHQIDLGSHFRGNKTTNQRQNRIVWLSSLTSANLATTFNRQNQHLKKSRSLLTAIFRILKCSLEKPVVGDGIPAYLQKV